MRPIVSKQLNDSGGGARGGAGGDGGTGDGGKGGKTHNTSDTVTAAQLSEPSSMQIFVVPRRVFTLNHSEQSYNELDI